MATAAVEKQGRPDVSDDTERLRHARELAEDLAAALDLDPAGKYSARDFVRAALALRTHPPLIEVLTFDNGDHLSAVLASASVLEARGDHCHLRLKRDRDRVLGVVLCVEDQ